MDAFVWMDLMLGIIEAGSASPSLVTVAIIVFIGGVEKLSYQLQFMSTNVISLQQRSLYYEGDGMPTVHVQFHFDSINNINIMMSMLWMKIRRSRVR